MESKDEFLTVLSVSCMFPFLPMKNLIDLFLIFFLDKIDSLLTIYLACRILCFNISLSF